MESLRLGLIFSTIIFFSLRGAPQASGQIDSTNIPLFIINTHGAPVPDEPKIPASLKIIHNAGKYNHPADSGNVYDGAIGIEIRGRYSASLPQKPYGFETRDAAGNNLNVPLFGMPAENDWILLANYNDKVFMRNTLAFHLFRKMGHYAPRTRFCEVVLNGYYEGIYIFTEKIKRDKGRVNISKLAPADNDGDELTGGYIIKVDYYNENDSWVSSYPPPGHADKKVHFVYSYPKPEAITLLQKTYIKNFINEFETKLYTPGTNLSKLDKYIDISSFIDYFIINELARNVDGYKKSSFFHKDKDSRDGRLRAGPIWDFDWAWKNIGECYFGATDGSGWAYKVFDCNPWPMPPGWTLKLMKNHEFVMKMAERYRQLRTTVLSEGYLFNYVDSVHTLLDKPQSRHYARWQILGINVGAPETDGQPLTYAGEIDKFKNWITTRLRWLDRNIPSLVVTATEDKIPKSSHRVFPNPAKEVLWLKTDNLPVESVYLTTMTGKDVRVMNTYEKNMIFMDIRDLKPGVYIVTLTFQDGSVEREKIVIAQ